MCGLVCPSRRLWTVNVSRDSGNVVTQAFGRRRVPWHWQILNLKTRRRAGLGSVCRVFFFLSPGQAPYGTKPACAKRASYPDPPPRSPRPRIPRLPDGLPIRAQCAGQASYGAKPACAKRAAYPTRTPPPHSPPSRIPRPGGLYRGSIPRVWLRPELSLAVGPGVPGPGPQAATVCVCVCFYVLCTRHWEGDSGGHLLREMTSRGLYGLVCPSRTSERRGGGE